MYKKRILKLTALFQVVYLKYLFSTKRMIISKELAKQLEVMSITEHDLIIKKILKYKFNHKYYVSYANYFKLRKPLTPHTQNFKLIKVYYAFFHIKLLIYRLKTTFSA